MPVNAGFLLNTQTLEEILSYFGFSQSITDLFTPCSRVRLEKLTGLQLVKKFPDFYGNRRFIVAYKSARHLLLSWTSSIQYMPPHSTSHLILSSYLRLGLPSGLFPSGFPTKTLYTALLSFIQATCTTHLILLDFIARKILSDQYRTLSSSICSFLHSPVISSLLGSNILLNTRFSNTSAYFTPSMRKTRFQAQTQQQAKLYFSPRHFGSRNAQCSFAHLKPKSLATDIILK